MGQAIHGSNINDRLNDQNNKTYNGHSWRAANQMGQTVTPKLLRPNVEQATRQGHPSPSEKHLGVNQSQ